VFEFDFLRKGLVEQLCHLFKLYAGNRHPTFSRGFSRNAAVFLAFAEVEA
jgi:hypothetical protein